MVNNNDTTTNPLVETIKYVANKEFNDELINEVLSRILDYFGGSRAYIYRFNWDQNLAVNTYTVFNEKAKENDAEFGTIPLKAFDHWIRHFEHGNDVYEITNIDELSKDPIRRQEYLSYKGNGIYSLVAVPLRKDGKLFGYIGINNPTKNKDRYNELVLLSLYYESKENERTIKNSLEKYTFVDDLTQLKNKNAYLIYLDEIKKREVKKTGVVFADVNSLKYTNDTYGHQQGDKLISHMGVFLKKHFSLKNVYRVSGDEFIAVVENIDKQAFENLVNEFKNDIKENSPNLASVGSYWEGKVFNLQQNIFFAEMKMYEEKKFYHESINKTTDEKAFLDIFLKEMKKDIFTFFCHPIFSATTGKLVWVEALSRRITKDNKVVSPFEYIPLLKKEHLIADFELDFLELVFKSMHEWKNQGIPLVPFKFVLSDQTLLSPDFTEKLDALINKYEIDKTFIIITLLILPSDKARQGIYEIVEQLHDAGIKIVVESIVGEFDNFEWALSKGIDCIVFSRNITTKSLTDVKARLVLESLINLAKAINIKTILRGVESQSQLDSMLELHPDYLQGFYFDKPMEKEVFVNKYLLDKDFKIELNLKETTVSEAITEFDSNLFELLSSSLDNTYLVISDIAKKYSRWSSSAVKYFNLPSEYTINAIPLWLNYIHPDDRASFSEAMSKILTGKKNHITCEYRALNANGDYVWIFGSGTITRKEDGSLHMFVGTLQNLGKTSKFDALTGLINAHQLVADLQKVKKENQNNALMLFGIDFFKRINELYGFSTGDKILKMVAERLTKVNPDLMVYRMDGDKFVCLVKSNDEEDAKKCYNDIQKELIKQYNLDGIIIHLSLSCGIILLPANNDTPDELRNKAEYTLGQAKLLGPGSMLFYSKESHYRSLNTLKITNALNYSINHNFEGFSLNFQPLVKPDGSIFGAEALLRYNNKDLGPIYPNDFIPLLEENGGIEDVGKWVINEAIYQAKKWRKLQPDFTVSINVSYLQIKDQAFKSYVINALEAEHMPSDLIILELTESCNVTDPIALQTTMDFFKQHGIEIALDDFGTGYASMGLLRILNPNWIKIDHSFVKSITEKEFDKSIIEYILQLCQHAKIKCVVEGIENEEVLSIIKQFKPELYQGYYYSKPLTAKDFEDKYFK